MIKKLYIKDFRNIQELTVEPSQFVNLISGNNGEGKSSILYAIEYLLTDNLNEKISEYIRWGCEKFYLEMEFIINSDNYFIKIEGEKSAKKELIINDDKENIYKNSEATKKLAEIIAPNIIRYSSISEQGKTAQILFDTPTNRLKKLKEILGIDKLADLSEEMKKDVQEREITIRESDKEIKLLEERQYEYIDVPELQDIEQIKDEFDLLDKDRELCELQTKLYNKYLTEKTNYDKACKIIETNQEFILKYFSSIEELNKSQVEYNHIESEGELREQLSKYEKEKIDQEYKTKNFKKIINRIDELKNNIEQQNQELEKYQLRRLSPCSVSDDDIINQETLISELEIKQASFRKELELARQGKCPTCGKDYIVDIEGLQKVSEDNSRTLLFAKTQLKILKDTLSKYNNEKNEREIVEIKRQAIQDKRIECIKELNEKEVELKQNCNKGDDAFLIDADSILKEIKAKLENRKMVLAHNVKISDEVREFENKIKVCRSLIEQVQGVKKPEQVEQPKEYDKKKYDDLNKEIIIYDQKVQERDRILKHNEEIDEKKRITKERIKYNQDIIDSLSHEVSILKESRQVLDKEFSAYLIDKGAEYIKDKMNEFFSQAYGKYNITFSQDKNSIDFFYSDGENISPCSMASGFEKSCLAIAFRIALSSLNNLGLMILDEIDSDASSDRSLQLYESVLNNMSSNQFFIITHSDETKEFLLQQQGSKEFNVANGKLN